MKNFEDILNELSDLLDVDLSLDSNRACVIVLNEKIKIQMEQDIAGEYLTLAAMIADLAPGKFREEVLKSALKVNNTISYSTTILAFVAKLNKLVLYEKIPMIDLNGQKLYDLILDFFHKAENWKNAIEGGKTAPNGVLLDERPSSGSNFFGLR